jgi:hypothetical protein
MSEDDIIHPDYIRLIERKIGGWLFKRSKVFYGKRQITVDSEDYELLYGISKPQVVVELFRINAGKAGYYLADLRHKKYYYCGEDVKDVKTMLLNIGIGRPDPHDN